MMLLSVARSRLLSCVVSVIEASASRNLYTEGENLTTVSGQREDLQPLIPSSTLSSSSSSSSFSSSSSPSPSDTEEGRVQSVCLPTVFMPADLQESIDSVLTAHIRKQCSKDGHKLGEFLKNRRSPDTEWTTARKSSDSNATEKQSKTKSARPWALKPSRAITSDDDRNTKLTKWAPGLKYGKRESLAFLASRTQASYGTALRVLSEIAKRNKSYSPQTLLDFGSGLGTVEWAARQLWKDSVYEYQCVDISTEMLDMAKRLRLGGKDTSEMLECEKKAMAEIIAGVYSRQYLPLNRKVQYDIVVSAHSLGELPSSNLRSFTVGALWRKAKDYLILIEAGTWSGYRMIMEARNLILNAPDWTKFEGETAESLKGHVFAPCPHDGQCPLVSDPTRAPKNPCHFAQRVQLSLSEKSTFLKSLGCHIENFSYVVFKKGERTDHEGGQPARLIEPIKKRSRHILCQVCTAKGEVKRAIFTKKKHGELYKEGRKGKWGDVVDISEYDT